MDTKRCSKCGKVKPILEFPKDKNRKDGLYTWCKQCCAEYKATPAGKASHNKYNATPAGKASRKKYLASPAGKASNNKYNASPDRKASNNKYNATPAGKATRARECHTRRANGKLVVNDLTDEQWAKRLKENNYCCYRCGKPFTIDDPATRDHIVPPKLKNGQVGLGLTFENILPAHRSCNASKSNNLDMGRLNTWFVLLK